jgi:hypothetical protein
MFVTFFADIYAKTLETREMTPREFFDFVSPENAPTANRKEDLRWFSLTRFGDKPSDAGCLRTEANALGCWGVELDGARTRQRTASGGEHSRRAYDNPVKRTRRQGPPLAVCALVRP